MYNESVEFHVLSIEGSDKTRIRRTNGTQEKSAVRESLIRWKLSDFQLRTA